VAGTGSLRTYLGTAPGVGKTYAMLAEGRGLAEATRSRGAATVVVGRHQRRLAELAHGSVSSRLRRLLPAVSVEEVGHP
jgi:two-component system, OmpR family, sensor histidine kinase KdpD